MIIPCFRLQVEPRHEVKGHNIFRNEDICYPPMIGHCNENKFLISCCVQ